MQSAVALRAFDGLALVEPFSAPITMAQVLGTWPLELVHVETARVEVALTMSTVLSDGFENFAVAESTLHLDRRVEGQFLSHRSPSLFTIVIAITFSRLFADR